MAIASLSTLSTAIFKGGAHLAGTSSSGLVTKLNLIIAKVNEIIAGLSDGSIDTLLIGDGLAGGAYYGGSDSWFSVDGTNPPTCERLRMLDAVTGGYREISMENGVVTVN